MRISEPVLTNINISKALWENDIHTLQNGIGLLLHIYVIVAMVLILYDDFKMTKIVNLSNWK